VYIYDLGRTEASEFKMHAPVYVGRGVGWGGNNCPCLGRATTRTCSRNMNQSGYMVSELSLKS
jgi:hypothetical protein